MYHVRISWPGDKGYSDKIWTYFLKIVKKCLMHFLYGLMVPVLQLCGSLKTMSAAERFCPVTKRFKSEVTLNQPDKSQFKETDLYNR